MTEIEPWIGVDFDGTLAEYHEWKGPHHIGGAIKPMIERVKLWLREGKKVKIFTARAGEGETAIKCIKKWLVDHGLPELEVTNIKDHGMIELWDDRCVPVKTNKGIPLINQD